MTAGIASPEKHNLAMHLDKGICIPRGTDFIGKVLREYPGRKLNFCEYAYCCNYSFFGGNVKKEVYAGLDFEGLNAVLVNLTDDKGSGIRLRRANSKSALDSL